MRKTETASHRIETHCDVVEHHLPLDPILFEFPRQDIAVGRHADLDAVVGREVLRDFRPRVLAERGRSVDDSHAHLASDLDRDHVLGELLAESAPAS